MKSTTIGITFLSFLMSSSLSYAQEQKTDNVEKESSVTLQSLDSSRSLLKQLQKYEEKQKVFFHPSLLTYEKGFLAQGEKTILYSLEVSRDNKIIYEGKFNIQNSKPLTVFTGMYQSDKDSTEVIKKNTEVDGEGQKASESKKIKSLDVSLIMHIKEDSDNLYSQFFIEQQDKDFSKEVAVAKSGSKIMGNQSVKGPENMKDKDEFIIQHKNNSKTIMTWRDYTFKVLADN